MHDLQRRPKDFNALEKERPLLFKEDRKTLIRRYDSFVSLALCEVRIQGGVERDCRSNTELNGQSRIEMQRLVYETSRIEPRCARRQRRHRSEEHTSELHYRL